LDPEAIARAEEAIGLPVPEREREHAPEARDAVGAPPPVGREDHLRIGGRAERPVGVELRAKLDVVIDLAVVGDAGAVGCGHRLCAGRQVDDAETAVCEADGVPWSGPDADAVRTAMRLEVVHRVDCGPETWNRSALEMNDTRNAAHVPDQSF